MSRLHHRRVPTGPHLRVASETLVCDECDDRIHAGRRYVKDGRRDYHPDCYEDEVEELEFFEEEREERRREESFADAVEDFVEDVFGDW